MASEVIDNPVLNGPYELPTRHWMNDGRGHLIADIALGRRPSESWVPVPAPKKRGRGAAAQHSLFQDELDVTTTGERVDVNQMVNDLRAEVDLWRHQGYPRTTKITARLLRHWADPQRDNKVFFAQREAVETAVYLTEVAGRLTAAEVGRAARGLESGRILTAIDELNAEYNGGLPRIALKMATGTGKTVVMAMLVAWQTLNKVARPTDGRFTKRFLVVTPGITIKDRLRVLHPSDPGNYYRERDLVPADLWPNLMQARVAVTNFHAFMPRTRTDMDGVAAKTKQVLRPNGSTRDFLETDAQMVARVLRDLGGVSGRSAGQIMVLNDEAHHCYAPRDAEAEVKELESELRAEAKEANKEAGVWFTGLQRIHELVGIKRVVDLSATPYFLPGSGYGQRTIFPWVVSDFSLIDAIEAGLVKVPRLPVADDSTGETVTYLELWDEVKDDLPKRVGRAGWDTTRPLPGVLAGALQSLYSSYERAFRRWESSANELGTPPVFIVVCPNTTVSKWVYDQVAGFETTLTADDGTEVARTHPGTLPLLSNYADGRRAASPRTILVDSAELESGEAVSKDFRDVVADEIDAFRREYVARTGSAVDEIDDAQLLREVLNTVGKPGRLGAGIRCVVSVSMLSEGWDATTVSHILGVRAFGSQLLCEQVVGRGLRRRSYAIADDGYLPVEYAEVYGIPFSFIPSDRPTTDPPPRPPVTTVRAVEGRESARIEFPRVDGYRFELPDERLLVDLDAVGEYVLDPGAIATRTEVAGVAGAAEEHDLDSLRRKRHREVAFRLAVDHVLPLFVDGQKVPKPWLVPELVRATEAWLDAKVRCVGTAFPGMLLLGTQASQAAEAVQRTITTQAGNREPVVRAIIRAEAPTGTTDEVNFQTTKQTIATGPRSHVSHVVLDGAGGGNTWEQLVAEILEHLDGVAAYVKNDHLEFAIPYTHQGVGRRYRPDFLVRLERRDPEDVERYLVIEVSGGMKDQVAREVKADTARHLWCAAVNADGRFGRWGYVEVDEPYLFKQVVTEAIRALYADLPITGLPTAIDLFEGLDDTPLLATTSAEGA